MWRCAPTPSRSSDGCVEANSRPTRAIVSAGTPHTSAHALDRVVVQAREQVVEAGRVRAAPRLVVQPRVDDRAHHPERERRRRCPGSGRRCSSATRAVRLRNGSTTTSLAPARRACEDAAPQVRRGRHRVPAPARGRSARSASAPGRPPATRRAWRRTPATPGVGADRALEVARAERVEHPRAHRVALQEPHRAEVGVRQHGLRAVRGDGRLEAPGDQVRASSHAGVRKRPSPFAPDADQRIEHAIARRRRDRGSWTPCRTGTPP